MGDMFRGAIADALCDADDLEIDCACHRTTYAASGEAADVVLAMTEMQAIKSMLAFHANRDCCAECHAVWLEDNLPAAVVAWVLSGGAS